MTADERQTQAGLEMASDTASVTAGVTAGVTADVHERLLQSLAARGYSSTRPRRAIIDAIAGAPGYLSPADILAAAREVYPRLGSVTVYRTLDILVDAGLVRRVHLANGCHFYALAEKTHGHHIICQSCRQVVEFEGCDLSNILGRVESDTGYIVKGHWLEMFGLCPACRAKEQWV
jgi:Fur family transcriptional regulator, ferric uptake regulator